MNELEMEIKKYDMMFLMVVRGSGGSKKQRCLWDVYGCAEKRSIEARRHAWVWVEPEEGLAVHNEEDLFLARCFMKRRLEGNEEWLKNPKSSDI